MRKILLTSTTIMTSAFMMSASAHVRDGLVDTSPTNFELTIEGEVSTYQAVTMIDISDANGNAINDETYFGQNYSADIDFIAKTHIRDWEIKARVEVDYNSNDNIDVDEVYMDFKHSSIGTFRLGRAPAPSDELSLEVDLPGENYDDDRDFVNNLASTDFFRGIGNSRFADDANQISYFSPKFGDMFQFGVAYIFASRSVDENVDSFGNVIDVTLNTGLDHDGLNNDTNDDAVEVAAKFEKEFNGFDFAVSGAYRYFFNADDNYVASDNTVWTFPSNVETQWTAGLKFGYLGFDWITTYGETYYADADREDWGVRSGVIYTWDRLQMGAAYEIGVDGQNSDDTLKTQLVEASAAYQVFTGMIVHANAGYAWSDFDENGSYADYDASGFQLRTGIDLSW